MTRLANVEKVGYLAENGRELNLITLLDDGEGQGYAAWRVLPPSDAWEEIVQAGLQERALDFSCQIAGDLPKKRPPAMA